MDRILLIYFYFVPFTEKQLDQMAIAQKRDAAPFLGDQLNLLKWSFHK